MTRKDWLEISAMLLIAPLLLIAAAFYQQHYFGDKLAQIQTQKVELPQLIEDFEQNIKQYPPMGQQLKLKNGKTMSVFTALGNVRQAYAGLETAGTLASFARTLGWLGVLSAALCIAVAVTALLFIRTAHSQGMASRVQLLDVFTKGRKLVPLFMASHTALLGLTLALICVGIAVGFWKAGRMSGNDIKMMLVMGVFALAALGLLVTAFRSLRNALQAFKPTPNQLLGRPVSREQAPGLWQLLTILGKSLSTAPPENVVVGLEGGPFVTGGDTVLMPSQTQLTGRTLYLPLPLMSVLSHSEAASILAHELAHFAGDDVRYSSEFIPNFAAVQSATNTLATEQGTSWFNYLTGRAGVMMGSFFMWAMDLCAHHHSRERELIADAAGGKHSGAQTAASALLRASSSHVSINTAMNKAFEDPNNPPDDLVKVCTDYLLEQGWPDVLKELDSSETHPFDTHPTNAARLTNWGYSPVNGLPQPLMQDATRAPEVYPGGALARFFSDPVALSKQTTADLAHEVQQHHAQEQEFLRDKASKNTATVEVFEPKRNAKWGIAIGVICVLAGVGFGGFLLSTKQFGLAATAGGISLSLGAFFLVMGWLNLRKLSTPAMVLRAGDISLMDCDRSIPWEDIHYIEISRPNNIMIQTVFHLDPGDGKAHEIKSPVTSGFVLGRRTRWQKKLKLVTITHALPKDEKPEDYAQRIFEYHESGRVRAMIRDGKVKLDQPAPVNA